MAEDFAEDRKRSAQRQISEQTADAAEFEHGRKLATDPNTGLFYYRSDDSDPMQVGTDLVAKAGKLRREAAELRQQDALGVDISTLTQEQYDKLAAEGRTAGVIAPVKHKEADHLDAQAAQLLHTARLARDKALREKADEFYTQQDELIADLRSGPLTQDRIRQANKEYFDLHRQGRKYEHAISGIGPRDVLATGAEFVLPATLTDAARGRGFHWSSALFDVATFVPGVGFVARAARAGKGLGRIASASARATVAPDFSWLTRPTEAAKTIGRGYSQPHRRCSVRESRRSPARPGSPTRHGFWQPTWGWPATFPRWPSTI